MARTAALLDWYHRHGRDLPWRHTRDPYRILVSEVMLQQTQVDRVVPRYERFLIRFPDEHRLAAAPRSEVLAEWVGLGYNRRAVNLHRAACHVAERGWPHTVEGLGELPGVGPYTAAAVAAFAFGANVAAIDINLRRVISRWLGTALSGAELRSAAAQLVPATSAADWNQAMMDLGATRCRPAVPRCDRCPVAEWCADPTVEVRSNRQAPFAGSNREARGAIVKVLDGTTARTIDEMAEASGVDADRLAAAAAQLTSEGLITATSAGYLLGA